MSLRLGMIREFYVKCRAKKHGAGRPSRRMALALALSCWFVATKHCPRFFRWYYHRAPDWIKVARSDLPNRYRYTGEGIEE